MINVIGISKKGIINVSGFYAKTSSGYLWRYEDGIIIDNGNIKIKELNPKIIQRKHKE